MNKYIGEFIKEHSCVDRYVVEVEANSKEEAENKIYDGEFEVVNVIPEWIEPNIDFCDVTISKLDESEKSI